MFKDLYKNGSANATGARAAGILPAEISAADESSSRKNRGQDAPDTGNRGQDARDTFHTGEDGVNLRGWFIIYLGYLLVLTVLALGLMGLANESNATWVQKVWLLPLYLFYLSLCCTFFPAPTAWIVLLLASPMVGLIAPDTITNILGTTQTTSQILAAVLTILIVAATGALGTMMANLNEYHIFTFLLRYGRVKRIRHARFYDRVAQWFSSSPFSLLVMISFIPIPVDVVRWLAITHRYPRGRYAAAYFLGRLVRYSLLAATATVLHIGWLGIALIQGGLVLILLIHVVRRLLSRRVADTIPVDKLAPETEAIS
ncbi:MAG: hypothetical protein JW709_02960 [Sedimentisphaerales bacterium]|nr:hypothetical protein [Sedimentisphaerales bacterium]